MMDVRYKADMPPIKEDAQLIHVLFRKTLVNRIDDFRFANRCQSRAEAIVTLLEMALSNGAGKSEKRGKGSPAK